MLIKSFTCLSIDKLLQIYEVRSLLWFSGALLDVLKSLLCITINSVNGIFGIDVRANYKVEIFKVNYFGTIYQCLNHLLIDIFINECSDEKRIERLFNQFIFFIYIIIL